MNNQYSLVLIFVSLLKKGIKKSLKNLMFLILLPPSALAWLPHPDPSPPASRPYSPRFPPPCPPPQKLTVHLPNPGSGGARSRNLGGEHLRGNTHFGGGQDRISRNLPSPSLPKFLTPWIFFHTFFPKFFPTIFSRTFLIFFQTFQNCPDLPKFFTDLPKMFLRPTKM